MSDTLPLLALTQADRTDSLDNTMSQAQLAEAIEHIFRQNGVRGAFVNLKNKTNAFGTVTPYAFVQFKVCGSTMICPSCANPTTSVFLRRRMGVRLLIPL